MKTTAVESSLSTPQRLTQAFLERPVTTIICAGMIPVGLTGLLLGQSASRAFSIISGGLVVSHLYGALLATGGLLALGGLGRNHRIVEIAGLLLITLGATVYATGVFIGLGKGGLIAGGGFLVLATALVAQVLCWLSRARQLKTEET